jgi:hypothetical protein
MAVATGVRTTPPPESGCAHAELAAVSTLWPPNAVRWALCCSRRSEWWLALILATFPRTSSSSPGRRALAGGMVREQLRGGVHRRRMHPVLDPAASPLR